MNAPKKLWFDIDDCSAGPVQFSDDEIPYIRADIVNELVEALEALVRNGQKQGWNDKYEWDMDKARAALAKMEESHE